MKIITQAMMRLRLLVMTGSKAGIPCCYDGCNLHKGTGYIVQTGANKQPCIDRGLMHGKC
jgi:hypothetical protein